jgi:hypothetical protein
MWLIPLVCCNLEGLFHENFAMESLNLLAKFTTQQKLERREEKHSYFVNDVFSIQIKNKSDPSTNVNSMPRRKQKEKMAE